MAEEREVKESGYGIGIIVGAIIGIVLFLLTFRVLLLAK